MDLNPIKKILIVEDDPYTNELMTSALKMADYEVSSVFSGEEAVRTVLSDLPDLIVLDLLMPKMDGWELCRELRKEDSPARRVPIVIASVMSRFGLGGEPGKVPGPISFFNKPFEPADLIKEVERIGFLNAVRDSKTIGEG